MAASVQVRPSHWSCWPPMSSLHFQNGGHHSESCPSRWIPRSSWFHMSYLHCLKWPPSFRLARFQNGGHCMVSLARVAGGHGVVGRVSVLHHLQNKLSNFKSYLSDIWVGVRCEVRLILDFLNPCYSNCWTLNGYPSAKKLNNLF